MYKDKERQKEANRLAAQRKRDKQKAEGMTETEGVTQKGMTNQGMTQEPVVIPARPENYGQPDCECQQCKTNRAKGNRHIINHGPWRPAAELRDNEINRVSLPGDVDYEGACVELT